MASSSDRVGRAFGLGWRRVVGAPTLLGGAWLLTVLTALPAAWTVYAAVEEHVGPSLVARRIVAAPEEGWWGEFLARAKGVAATLQPDIIGAAAPLSNLSTFLDEPGRVPPSLVGTVILSLAAWLFLSGGIVDRYARGRRIGSRAFFGACGVFFFRFLRLGVLVGIAYWLLAGPYHSLLFNVIYPWLTRETTVERVAFVWRIALYLAWLAPVVLVNITVDYAKVRAVVEDRHSMIAALVAGWRFVRRHPSHVVPLYLANALVLAVALAVYILLAPGGRGGDWRLIAVLAIGQMWIVTRIATKLAFMATATALFQQQLAHAEYTAPPLPIWPDSPAAEAIENAARYGTRRDV
jgi:hypothetical protein